MIKQVSVSAPCKLNLHLEVGSIRSDGFHDVVSLFQLVSLADDMHVCIVPEENACHVECSGMDLPAVNTLTKAADVFRAETGIRTGVHIALAKHVPCGAGLGGGSSDAAALLAALDMLFGTHLSHDALVRCAAAVGSDVPFFITGGTAVVKGRGEFVLPVASRDGLHFVIIWPEVFCSTGEAYRMVDAMYAAHGTTQKTFSAAELSGEYMKAPHEWRFYNSFFIPVARKFPVVAAAADSLKANGAVYTALTGSGSAVFGVFTGAEQAAAAVSVLKHTWQYCYNVKPLSRYPVPVGESCE